LCIGTVRAVISAIPMPLLHGLNCARKDFSKVMFACQVPQGHMELHTVLEMVNKSIREGHA